LVQRRPSPTLDEDHTRLISGVDLFAPPSPAGIERIAQGIPSKRFEVGTHVFTPAYRGEIFFLLLEGRVRVYCLEAAREFTIGVLEPGEMFDEAAFIPREGGGSYAQAMAPSKVGFLTRSAFSRLVLREPELGIRTVELLAERLSFYELRIADIALKKVPARLAGVILQLAEQDGVVTGGDRYRILTHYTHDEVATMIGARRVAVTRAMQEMSETGAVKLAGRRLVVEDTKTLQRIAEDVA
jgi:CRP/FNR family transcriptional regulator, cyclic AMP receptor protein